MKQFKTFLAVVAIGLLTALGFSSCSQEDMPDSPNREGMVDVVMSTSLPQGLQTYGVNSAEGGLKNLEDKGYTVRYIMEIYPEGSTTKVQRMIKYVPISVDGTYRSTSFQTRLLASKYKFVFFADIVREVNSTLYPLPEGITAPYYYNRYFVSNTNEDSDKLYRPIKGNNYVEGDLQNICASTNANTEVQNPSTEMYDAYSCTEPVDLRNDPIQQEFVLKRPFAKLRLIATDVNQLLATPDWSKCSVKIIDSNIPTGYNALTGESKNIGEAGYWNGGALATTNETYSNEDGAERTVGVFYLPVPTNSQNLTFSINISDASGKELATGIELEVENVPLVGNKLTTIKGNLLSKNAVVNVRIDDEFEKDTEGNIDETIIEIGKEASTVEELKSKLSGGTEGVEYTGRVTKSEGFTLNFSEIEEPQTYSTVANPLYAEGNSAELTLKFSNIEEGAIFTFEGGVNAPKKLRIVTDTKCSLRINLASTDVYYDGTTYKYIVTNSGNYGKKTGLQYDALFGAEPGDRFMPANTSISHQFKLNADFTLVANPKCTFVSKHEGKVCNFLTTVQNWLSENSGKTVWDFVGNVNN